MSLTTNRIIPKALFDTKQHLFQSTDCQQLAIKNQADFEQAKLFLQLNSRSEGTYTSYRREIERLLHWSWLIVDKSLQSLSLDDLCNYVEFCKNPPTSWIATKKVNKFITINNTRVPNPNWRPFVSILSKSEHKEGKTSTIDTFKIAQNSLKEIIMILSTFFNYLIKNKYINQNPSFLLRQKFNLATVTKTNDIKLTKNEIQQILQTAKQLADADPSLYERTHFILNIIIYMGIKPSELITRNYHTPLMSDISLDRHGNWYITTNKKYKKQLDKNSLNALKRWRSYLSLTPLPYQAETIPLIPKQKGSGAVETTAHIRRMIQVIFDQLAKQFKNANKFALARRYQQMTVSHLSNFNHAKYSHRKAIY
ncbi:hypothetical protein L3V82_12885 [Thiotrichales bacterium 19S3-7]|nr:hypothetical protein [Thiotrichales bacterium 19S3-7]MCF6803068.1 hypothetical protein [Thiotrichales bacterium 19S3-11]